LEYLPTPHSIQLGAPAMLRSPAPHSTQIDSAIAAAAVPALPATQRVQLSGPDDALYVPEAQEIQLAPLFPV